MKVDEEPEQFRWGDGELDQLMGDKGELGQSGAMIREQTSLGEMRKNWTSLERGR